MTTPDAAGGAEKASIQSIGSQLLLGLHTLTRVLLLYEVNNAAVGRVIELMNAELTRFFEAGFSEMKLQLLEDEFFVNDRLLRVDAKLYERGCELEKSLKKFTVGEILIERGASVEELTRFVSDLGACLRGTSEQMPGGHPHITTAKGRQAGAAAAFRFEPDRLAIWMYASLLDTVEKLYAQAADSTQADQDPPSLRPIRRILQMIIDGMRDHGGIYQMLSVVREPDSAPSIAHQRAAICIDAIGLGTFIGLSSNDRMTLALSGLLGGLSDASDPEEAVKPLMRFRGLADSAMPLVLTVFDTRSARLGKPAGVPGRLLAVVESYHGLISAREPRLSLGAAIQAMALGKVENTEIAMAKVFALYKGRYPIGSVVQLSTGQPGVVLSHQDSDAGKLRPLVGLLQQTGKLSEHIDLSQRNDVQITSVVSSQKAGIRLSDL